MVKRVGDGHPSDKNTENLPFPKEGQIFKLNKKDAKGFDFVRIAEIVPVEKDRRGKARIHLEKWNPETNKWVKGLFSSKMLLETFLEKNDAHNYIFAHDSERSFFNAENIPITERPTRPLDVSDLDEPKDPTPENVEHEPAEPEELVLGPEREVVKEAEAEPPTPEPEPEPERVSYPTQQMEGVIRELLLSNEKVKKIDRLEIEGNRHRTGLRIKMHVETPPFISGEVAINVILINTSEGLKIDWYEIYANPLVKSALEKELVPRLNQVSEILSKYIEENSGKKVTKIEISDTGELVAIFDAPVSAPTETKITPPVASGPVEPTVPDPEELPISSLDHPKELTPEQQGRAKLGERLGLNPEQLSEREQLETSVDETRAEYVNSLYAHEQSMVRVLSIVSLKRNPEPDEVYKQRYQASLEKLQAFDITHLQDILAVREGQEAIKNSTASYIERYTRLEATALWAEQQEIRAVWQEAHGKTINSVIEKIPLGKQIAEKAGALVEQYQKLPLWKKLTIGGGLVGLHASIAVVSTPVAVGSAALWLGAKMVTGAAAYKSTNKLAVQGAQWVEDKLDTFSDKRDIKKLGQKFAEGSDGENKYLEKLNQIALTNISNLDQKLKNYEEVSTFAKAASLALIFGVPLGRYFGDIMGASSELAAGASATAADTLEATEHFKPEAPEGTALDPNTPATEASVLGGDASTAGAEVPSIPAESLGVVTVTEADQARGLWGIIDNKLPGSMTEAEKIPAITRIEALIQQKFEGLTDAQIKEQYGFSSRNISLIHPGENLKLGALVSQEELKSILNGTEGTDNTAAPVENPITPNPAEASAADTNTNGNVSVEEKSTWVNNAETEAAGYLNSDTIGFRAEPPTEREVYWRSVQDVQGKVPPEFGHYDGADPSLATELSGYTYEMSDYRQLLQDPIAEGVNIPALQRESMTLLNGELWDINNTEFGPDYQPTNWTMQEVEGRYQNNSIQEMLTFDNSSYNYDPRPGYRANEWALRTGRGIYLDPINPGPTLNSPPDAYAIATMDQIRDEYRHNITDMTRAAVSAFGRAAYPVDTLVHKETVREYMMRVATLYTRARLENPNFRLNF